MKKAIYISVPMVLIAIIPPCSAQESPQVPLPQKEHAWLQRLVGEWETEAEIFMEPGQPPLKAKGTESTRAIGGFWVLGNVNGEVMGAPYEAILTIGYDTEKKKYVGTWIDSMNDYLWNYTGTVDPAGNKLTLETRGPCPTRPGELTNIREVIELKGDDERVFSSEMEEKDGTWKKMMTVNYRRKK